MAVSEPTNAAEPQMRRITRDSHGRAVGENWTISPGDMDTILIALQFHGESNTLGRSPAMSLHEALRAELARDLISLEQEVDAAILRIRQADTDFLTADLLIERTGCNAEQARAGLVRAFPKLDDSELAARFWLDD